LDKQPSLPMTEFVSWKINSHFKSSSYRRWSSWVLSPTIVLCSYECTLCNAVCDLCIVIVY
jgi:hypothetical protein